MARETARSQHASKIMSFPYRRQWLDHAAFLRALLRIGEGRKEQEVPHGCAVGQLGQPITASVGGGVGRRTVVPYMLRCYDLLNDCCAAQGLLITPCALDSGLASVLLDAS